MTFSHTQVWTRKYKLKSFTDFSLVAWKKKLLSFHQILHHNSKFVPICKHCMNCEFQLSRVHKSLSGKSLHGNEQYLEKTQKKLSSLLMSTAAVCAATEVILCRDDAEKIINCGSKDLIEIWAAEIHRSCSNFHNATCWWHQDKVIQRSVDKFDISWRAPTTKILLIGGAAFDSEKKS